MSEEFPRTMRGLAGDGHGRTVLALGLGALLLAAWTAWMLLARVAVHEVSTAARVELDRAAHALEAPVSGRVVSSALALGRQVEENEVLVALATEPEQLGIEEARTRTGALGPQLQALEDEIREQELALAQEREASRAASAEAQAKYKEASVTATQAAQALDRGRRLHDTGLVSDAELDRLTAESARAGATAETLRLAAERLEPELRTRERDRAARIEQARREASRIEGEIGAGTVAAGRLAREAEEKSIRAPVRGTIVEAASIEAGAYVHAGDRLGVVLGAGDLHVVADFAPEAALGRIRPGQPARLRLSSFPSSQYGTLRASVARMSSELRDGRVRVELAVDPASNPRLPLEHGLPGTIEVEVERVSPAVLLLRAAGALTAP